MNTNTQKPSKVKLTDATYVWEYLKTLDASKFAQELFQCAIDGHRGIYAPQAFTEHFPQSNIDQEVWNNVKAGPDNNSELYWDDWTTILDSWTYEGYQIHLGESGDVFVYRPALIEMWECATNSTDLFWDQI